MSPGAREVTILVVLLLHAAAAALDTITPNPEMQREIEGVATATGTEELIVPLGKLKATANQDPRELVRQLLYYSMHGTVVRQGMAAAIVIDRLGISKEQQLEAIEPYLGTSDVRLQQELRNLLGNLDGASASQPPDFSRYAAVLRARDGDPPLMLIAYMLETAPDQALATLADVYLTDPEPRRTLLAASGSHSTSVLEGLAQSDHWWVRLYVAERLKQEPNLRTPTLMQRLTNDSHPAVRAALGGKPEERDDPPP